MFLADIIQIKTIEMTETASEKVQIVCVFMFLMVGILFLENQAYFRKTMRLYVNVYWSLSKFLKNLEFMNLGCEYIIKITNRLRIKKFLLLGSVGMKALGSPYKV